MVDIGVRTVDLIERTVDLPCGLFVRCLVVFLDCLGIVGIVCVRLSGVGGGFCVVVSGVKSTGRGILRF